MNVVTTPYLPGHRIVESKGDGLRLRVWLDPGSGERRYVPED